MTAENSVLYHRNKLHFEIYYNKNSYFDFCKYFKCSLSLMYVWSNKCSLSGHKSLLSKTFKNVADPKLLNCLYLHLHLIHVICLSRHVLCSPWSFRAYRALPGWISLLLGCHKPQRHWKRSVYHQFCFLKKTQCVHKGLNSFTVCDLQIESTGSSMCPPGHYCPTGIGSPLPCPAGTFSSSPGLSGAEQCQPCPPGYFCEQTAMVHPSEAALCDAG